MDRRLALVATAAALALASACITSAEDGPALGSAEQSLVDLPAWLTLDWAIDNSAPPPTSTQLLGWMPDFSVNVPAFDSLNRASIRDRSTFQDWIPGTIQRLRTGAWEQRSFTPFLAPALACSPWNCQVCYDDGGGWNNAQLVFDRDDNLYTVVSVFTAPLASGCPTAPPEGQARLFLLRSSNFGSSWQPTELPCGEQYAMERPYSPEPLEGPPAVLVNDSSGAVCGTGSGTLTLVKPIVASGVVNVATHVLQTGNVMSIGSHSGGGTQVITHEGSIYAVWGRKVATGIVGSPVLLAAVDIVGTTLAERDRVTVTDSRPTNDGHNRAALAIETTGHINVMVGSHQCAFRHLRSTAPLDIRSFPGLPATTIALDPHVCAYEDGDVVLGQTYVAMVRDRFDTLHLVYRLYQEAAPEGYYLVYQRKVLGQPWEAPQTLVDPPIISYSIYYHQLAIDHRGNIYVLFSWYSEKNCTFDDENEDGIDDNPCTAPGSWFQLLQLYKYAGVLVSHDGGSSWHLGSTEMFDDATFWEPASGAVADLDGNGLKDVVHAYWDHGMELHIDGSFAQNGAWAGWTTRGRRLRDGAQILQTPVLAGNVNAPADNRDDLVFVYRDPDLRIRTQLARADGGFDTVTAPQTDGALVPDAAYPPMIGDVTGDGRADIVMPYWRDNCLNVRTKRSLGNGSWTTLTASCVATTRMDQYPVRLGNVDPGGRADLVFLHRDAGGLKSRVLLSNGNGTWTATADQAHSDGTGIHQYAHLLGDVNGDTFDDLVFWFWHWDTGQFTVRVKYAHGNGYGWSGSRESQHPDGDQIPHYTPMIGKVNGDACADLLFPHRLGEARDGRYQLRSFLAVCDGSRSALFTRTTTQLP